jgi:regulator of sigma E protease
MTSVLIFLLVLSVLIFVHELGHFLAAKACNVYVDRFSIGMPPRILGFKYGETDYCIGALPFGGFVKMAGQEDAPLTEEERERDYGTVPPDRWFNKKPVYQRIIILLAGPFMNLLLAAVIYAGIFAWGTMVPEGELSARIGEVAKGSPAESALLYKERPGASITDYTGTPDAVGWKTGDIVVSLDGKPIDTIGDVAVDAVLGGEGKARLVLLDRPDADGKMTRYASPTTPAKFEEKSEYPRFGIGPFASAMVGELLEGMPGRESGLQNGDIIERLNGEYVDNRTFVSRVETTPENTPLDLTVKRGEERIHIQVTPRTIGRLLGVAFEPANGARGDAGETAEPKAAIVPDEYREQTGLRRKDRIVKINGQPATMKLLAELERAAPDGKLEVEVERPSVLFGILQKAEHLTLSLPVKPVRAVGIQLKPLLVFHRTPASEVLPAAFAQARKDVDRTVGTLVALIKRDVSMKDVGGPVMIFSITSAAAEEGLSWLLKTMAFISVNLCVFNLIPLPVLDGGQIVINLIEGIRRRPVSPVFLERFQMAGLFLIIMLMLFVTWNDVGRVITDLKP